LAQCLVPNHDRGPVHFLRALVGVDHGASRENAKQGAKVVEGAAGVETICVIVVLEVNRHPESDRLQTQAQKGTFSLKESVSATNGLNSHLEYSLSELAKRYENASLHHQKEVLLYAAYPPETAVKTTMSQAIQQLVLETLDKHNTIDDTRKLILPGEASPAATQDAQLAIIAALNSLLSRNVNKSQSKGLMKPECGQHSLRKEGALYRSEISRQKLAMKAPKSDKVSSIQDATQEEMREVASTGTLAAGDKALAELKKRKLITQRYVRLSRGSMHDSLDTQEGPMVADDLRMKNNSRCLQGVMEDIYEYFLGDGFVESGFWNFDTLFVPQQHPARDLQDTFYISDPAVSLPPPKEYYDKVSKVHAVGGFGSTGYRAPWSDEDSQKLLLRTHTTARSAYMLYKLATRPKGPNGEEGGFKPVKMFSIDRVFRNEATDATHLAEFHQVEGVVADRGITLGDLIGVRDPESRAHLHSSNL
ncbi:5566_t:CDS:10, partial [Acaulospora colombiana]